MRLAIYILMAVRGLTAAAEPTWTQTQDTIAQDREAIRQFVDDILDDGQKRVPTSIPKPVKTIPAKPATSPAK